MIFLLSPAKTMTLQGRAARTQPRFAEQTHDIITQMLPYSEVELQRVFKISPRLAQELHASFAAHAAKEAPSVAAIDGYDGVVLKHLKAGAPLDEQQGDYLQQHARLCSLLYGLLRPLDAIRPYRMEGYVRLPSSGIRVDKYWRDHQTPLLIEDAQAAGGTLIYLASKEEQQAFHWKSVEQALRVIHIDFLQRKGDKLRPIVVYTKMARGEMLRYAMQQRITSAEALKEFCWHGYVYNEAQSDAQRWVWVKEADC